MFLYERYLAALTEQRFYDVNMVMERAVRALEVAAAAAPLMIYGFYDFTPLQQRLIAATVRGRDVLAFFPWRRGMPMRMPPPPSHG